MDDEQTLVPLTLVPFEVLTALRRSEAQIQSVVLMNYSSVIFIGSADI